MIPPFNRGFIGGEQDVRGFQIMGITPIGWVLFHPGPVPTTTAPHARKSDQQRHHHPQPR